MLKCDVAGWERGQCGVWKGMNRSEAGWEWRQSQKRIRLQVTWVPSMKPETHAMMEHSQWKTIVVSSIPWLDLGGIGVWFWCHWWRQIIARCETRHANGATALDQCWGVYNAPWFGAKAYETTLTGSPWTNTALELGTEEDIVMALFTVGFSKEMLVLARLLSNSFMDYTKEMNNHWLQWNTIGKSDL